jgi:hypothetical protein
VKTFVGASPAHLLPRARLQNRSCQSGMGRRELVCVRLVLVARLARCALGVLCGLGHVLCVVGGLGPFISVFARFPPKKPDTFLINLLGQCLLPPFQKKKNTITSGTTKQLTEAKELDN